MDRKTKICGKKELRIMIILIGILKLLKTQINIYVHLVDLTYLKLKLNLKNVIKNPLFLGYQKTSIIR